MAAGPDLIVACPHCKAPARIATVDVPDLTGSVTWSDGCQVAPLLPQPVRIARCPACAKPFWSWEAEQLGYEPAGEAPSEASAWPGAPYLEPLDAAGMARALAEGMGSNRELEMELRVLLWWRGNDEFRKPDAPAGHPTAPEAIANLDVLIEAMTHGEEDLLLFRAEAQRELGRFEDALETLRGVCCSDWWPAKSRLLELIQQRSRDLAILFGPEPAPEEQA